MKQKLLLLLIALSFSGLGWGQTTIFSVSGGGTLPSGWTSENNVATNPIDKSTYYLLDAGNPSDRIITTIYDLSAYNEVVLNVDVATYGSGTAYPMKIEFSTNGGTSWSATTYVTATPSSSTYITGGPITITQTFSSTTKFRFSNNGTSGRGVRIQNLIMTGTPSGSTPPTLTADATSNTVDNNIDITFTDDATWRAAVTAVKIGGTALTVTTDYVLTTGNLQLKPSGLNALLTTSGSKSVTVEATGYSVASVTQQIDAGAATKLGMKTQPTAPASNGAVLATQPAVYIQDQFGNTTTSTATVVAAVGAGAWTLGGTTSVAAVAGTTTYSDLTATSAAAVTGATISFTSSGLTGINSSAFDITAPPLDAPVAIAATNISTTGFAANWNAASGASSYRLDVATSSSFASGESETVDEGFDDGTTVPTDWTFTNINGTYTTSGNYGASSPSLKLDATGNAIETPTLSAEATSLSFWLKGQGTDAASALLVEGHNGTSWETIENITNSIPTTGTTYTYNSGTSPALASGIIKFRFTYTKSSGNLSFDDVSYSYSTPSTFVAGYQDQNVDNVTTKAVTGLTPNTTYYYRVRATDGVETSVNSNTISASTDASAASTYTGTGNWSEVGNWSAGLPGATTNVTVNGTLTVDDVVECNNLTISTSGAVTVTAGQGLSINGDFLIQSSAAGTGSFIAATADYVITGTSTVQRYLTNYSSSNDGHYHFISSPITAQAIQPEFVENTPFTAVDFYKYDEPTNTWINTKTEETGAWNNSFGDNFVVGKGYLVSYPSTPVTKSFTGTLNSYSSGSPLVINCTNTNDNGWNLIGNPFPSAIDWDLVTAGDLGDGMDNALYYYDASAANYRYYIQLSGESGSLGSGSQYIPSGQGFMVHAKTSGIKTVTLYKDHQTHADQSFYKSSRSLANQLILSVSKDQDEDETTLFFYQEATNGFDGLYDAYKIFSYTENMPQIYSIINGNTQLAINSMHAISENPTVILGFKTQKTGEFTLKASGLESFDSSLDLLLEDTYLNTIHNLRTDGNYLFYSESGDFTDRFEMHFGVVGLPENNSTNSIDAYVSGKTLYVNNKSIESEVSLFDIQGHQLLSREIDGAGSTRIPLDLPTGIYIVRLQSNNQVKNVKVFIN